MNTPTPQLSLFAAPAATPPPAVPPAPAKKPWRLTLTVYPGYGLLTATTPTDTPALLRLARELGLATPESAVNLPAAPDTALGDVGGIFLAHLARAYPDRELQVFRQRATPPAVSVPERPAWPVTVTVYADGGAVISVPDSQRVLFLALAHEHGFTTDGDVVVTTAYAVETGALPTHEPVSLDDDGDLLLEALPYTALTYRFESGPLPESYVKPYRLRTAATAALAEVTSADAAPAPILQTGDVIHAPGSLMDGATVIHTYTRAQALEDGYLVDVTGTAKEAGFRWPVAVTRAVWTLIEDIPQSQRHQSVAGRLWDVLWMAFLAVLAVQRRGEDLDTLMYRLIMHHGRHTYITLKVGVTGGDDGEPVITILTPEED